MNQKDVEEIREKVNAPEVNKQYGKWGILTQNQRKTIRELCDSWLTINEHDMQNNEKIMVINELLEQYKPSEYKSFIENQENFVMLYKKILKLIY